MMGKSIMPSLCNGHKYLILGHDTFHLLRAGRAPSSPPIHAPLQPSATGTDSVHKQRRRACAPGALQCVKTVSAQDASATILQPICVGLQDPGTSEDPGASVPGVYEVFDESGKLQYVGVSKQMALSLAGHAQALGPQLVHHARCSPVPSGRKADLQQAWKDAIVANGAVPPGNAKGETAWAQKPAPAAPSTSPSRPAPSAGVPQPSWHPQAPVQGAGRFSAAAAAAAPTKGSQPARPSLEQLRATTAACSHPAASATVTPSRVHQLCTQGFFVVDGVADPSLVASAQQGAESLRSVGLMIPVSQQRDMGRLDEILVLNEQQGSRLVVGGSRSVEPAVQEALTKPESGQETYYARHKEIDDSYQAPTADPHNNPAWAGPPGQRVRDRAVTSILYLNEGWDADRDGGCLRLFHTDGSGQFSDVTPESGRLVVFQACAVEHEVLPSFRQRWAMTAWVPTLISFQE